VNPNRFHLPSFKIVFANKMMTGERIYEKKRNKKRERENIPLEFTPSILFLKIKLKRKTQEEERD
jgi:hypothetical protein